MPISKSQKQARKSIRVENYRKRVPTQPAGMPQGEHLTGFKGTKVEGICLCGGCHPNARAGKKKEVVIYA